MAALPKHPVLTHVARVPGKPVLRYVVSMPKPWTHNLEVRVEIDELAGEMVELRIPSWTPGSYKIREFARNVSHVRITGANGKALPWQRTDKDTWRVFTGEGRTLRMAYRVYANEFSVRTAHVDDSHAYFLPANALPYVVGNLDAACTLTVEPWGDWSVTCPLPRLAGKEETFVAPDYDTLVDSPVECGAHATAAFNVSGKRHDIAVYGRESFPLDRMAADFERIVRVGERMFGSLPYDNYQFILHFQPDAAGGLEHLNSQVSQWSSGKLTERDQYENFLSLISHEYFHLWNVKRIRPAVLGPFEYNREVYTGALWVMEGLTTYYEWLQLSRAGLITPERALKAWSEDIDHWLGRPGNDVMGLQESSFLAWTKLYLRDENWNNTAVSYYLKGHLVGMLLDLEIRRRTKWKKSLDDVMRLALDRYGLPKTGFPEHGFEALVAEICAGDWGVWFERHLHSTAPLDFDAALKEVGLCVRHEASEVVGIDGRVKSVNSKAWPGWTLKDKEGAATVSEVLDGGPASDGGVSAGDEVVAIDDTRIRSVANAEALLARRHAGDVLDVVVSRRERVCHCRVTLAEKPANPAKLVAIKNVTPAHKRRLAQWLGGA